MTNALGKVCPGVEKGKKYKQRTSLGDSPSCIVETTRDCTLVAINYSVLLGKRGYRI